MSPLQNGNNEPFYQAFSHTIQVILKLLIKMWFILLKQHAHITKCSEKKHILILKVSLCHVQGPHFGGSTDQHYVRSNDLQNIAAIAFMESLLRKILALHHSNLNTMQSGPDTIYSCKNSKHASKQFSTCPVLQLKKTCSLTLNWGWGWEAENSTAICSNLALNHGFSRGEAVGQMEVWMNPKFQQLFSVWNYHLHWKAVPMHFKHWSISQK